MYPGFGHFYVIYYFGLSEISTAILAVLANFDDSYGIKGLGDEFVIIKIVTAVLFVISFIIIRNILWPVFSYYFITDILRAFKENNPKCEGRKAWMKCFMITCSSLSVLQLAWLAQLIITCKAEIEKLM